jgi:hypothetical protein
MNRAERILLWLLGGSASAVALAWIAFQIQQEQFAPAVLFPLAVGAALGVALLLVRRWTQWPNRRLAAASAIAWGLLLVVGQDYIGHRVRLGQFDAEIAGGHPLAAAMVGERDLRPSFGEHLATRFRGAPLWWTLDFVLTAAAAAAVVVIGAKNSAIDSAAMDSTGINSNGAAAEHGETPPCS